MNIKDFEITYMGKSCTIADYIKYNKNISSCKELDKIAPIVYIKKIVDSIEVDYYTIDRLAEILQSNMDWCNFLLIKVIQKLKLKDIPAYILDLINTENEDHKFDLFLKFIRECGIE